MFLLFIFWCHLDLLKDIHWSNYPTSLISLINTNADYHMTKQHAKSQTCWYLNFQINACQILLFIHVSKSSYFFVKLKILMNNFTKIINSIMTNTNLTTQLDRTSNYVWRGPWYRHPFRSGSSWHDFLYQKDKKEVPTTEQRIVSLAKTPKYVPITDDAIAKQKAIAISCSITWIPSSKSWRDSFSAASSAEFLPTKLDYAQSIKVSGLQKIFFLIMTCFHNIY